MVGYGLLALSLMTMTSQQRRWTRTEIFSPPWTCDGHGTGRKGPASFAAAVAIVVGRVCTKEEPTQFYANVSWMRGRD